MKGIQKRLFAVLLTVCMIMTATGCGRVKAAADVLMGKDEKAATTEEETIEPEETAEEPEEVVEEPEKKEASSDYPVLGQEGIADFDGYTYLYCEKLRTESTKNEESGKMESSELEVFIPLDEYVYVNRNYVSGNKLGVSYKVSLDPSIRYDEEDYLLSENLDYYLENNYDPFYSERYKDVSISSAQDVDSKSALATVEYLNYNDYDDVYVPVFCTYYLTELENGVEVLVEIEVNAADVTGKTPELIDELETFYPFDINWDADRANQKLETFLASGGDNSYTTGYVIFELPDGWAEDQNNTSYDTRVYAPGGDTQVAGCFVSLSEEYVGYNYAKDAGILGNQDLMIQAVEAMMTESGEKATVTYYGDTCLGEAAVADTVIKTDDGIEAATKLYFVFGESYIYVITSSQLADAADDADAVAQDILANGQARE